MTWVEMGEPGAGHGSVHLVSCEGQDANTPAPGHLAAMQKTCFETYPTQPPAFTSYYDNAFNNGYAYDPATCGQYYDEYVDYRATCGLTSNMMPQQLMMNQGPQQDYNSFVASQQMGYYEYESSFTKDYPGWAREQQQQPRTNGKKSPDSLLTTACSPQATALPNPQQSVQSPSLTSTQPSVKPTSLQQPQPPQGQPPTVITPPNQLTPISLPSGTGESSAGERDPVTGDVVKLLFVKKLQTINLLRLSSVLCNV